MEDNSLGIIQPGKLGDIIIVLPAAKYLHDKGYKVYWPVYDTIC
jgi:ADP-heptose:LPS heptosyltransferase